MMLYNSGPYPLCRYDKDGYVCSCGLSLIEDVYEMFISYRASCFTMLVLVTTIPLTEPMESYRVGCMNEANDFKSH